MWDQHFLPKQEHVSHPGIFLRAYHATSSITADHRGPGLLSLAKKKRGDPGPLPLPSGVDATPGSVICCQASIVVLSCFLCLKCRVAEREQERKIETSFACCFTPPNGCQGQHLPRHLSQPGNPRMCFKMRARSDHEKHLALLCQHFSNALDWEWGRLNTNRCWHGMALSHLWLGPLCHNAV